MSPKESLWTLDRPFENIVDLYFCTHKVVGRKIDICIHFGTSNPPAAAETILFGLKTCCFMSIPHSASLNGKQIKMQLF